MNDNNSPEKQQSGQRTEPKEPTARPGLLEVLGSVLAALFGVQSGKNRERDFRRGDPRDYILVFTLALAALVIGMILGSSEESVGKTWFAMNAKPMI